MAHGEGSIFKTKDSKGRARWKVEVTIGHKPDGTRLRTRRTAKTHAEALQIRRQLVTDRDEVGLMKSERLGAVARGGGESCRFRQ